MARTASADRVIFFPDTIENILELLPAGSEPANLLNALSAVRFRGADSSVLQKQLSGDYAYAFKQILPSLERDMRSYLRVCARNAGETYKSETNIVGGGMLIHRGNLRILIHLCQGTEAGAFLQALYDVEFAKKDGDEVEDGLTGRPRILFAIKRYSLLTDNSASVVTATDNSVPEPSSSSAVSETPSSPAASADSKADSTAASKRPYVKRISDEERSRKNTENIKKRWAKAEEDKSVAETSVHPESEPVTASNSDTQAVAEGAGATLDTKCDSNTKCSKLCINDGSICSNNDKFRTISYGKQKRKLEEKKDSPPTPSLTNTPQVTKEKNDTEDMFNRLWDAYPVKTAKDKALRVFNRLNPNDVMMDEIMSGLAVAKKQDRRFQGGTAYVPLLSNFLLDKDWLPENMLPIILKSNTPGGRDVPYGQRPYKTREEIEERRRRAMQALAERYGDK